MKYTYDSYCKRPSIRYTIMLLSRSFLLGKVENNLKIKLSDFFMNVLRVKITESSFSLNTIIGSKI